MTISKLIVLMINFHYGFWLEKPTFAKTKFFYDPPEPFDGRIRKRPEQHENSY